MTQAIRTDPASGGALWTGRILFAVPVLFFLFDSITHMMRVAPVVQAFSQLGYPVSLAVVLGIIQVVCLILYVIPRTAILGAILLTGYLGGAVSTNLRVSAGPFPVLFPVFIGVMFWGALYLRDNRLRELIPLRRQSVGSRD